MTSAPHDSQLSTRQCDPITRRGTDLVFDYSLRATRRLRATKTADLFFSGALTRRLSAPSSPGARHGATLQSLGTTYGLSARRFPRTIGVMPVSDRAKVRELKQASAGPGESRDCATKMPSAFSNICISAVTMTLCWQGAGSLMVRLPMA